MLHGLGDGLSTTYIVQVPGRLRCPSLLVSLAWTSLSAVRGTFSLLVCVVGARKLARRGRLGVGGATPRPTSGQLPAVAVGCQCFPAGLKPFPFVSRRFRAALRAAQGRCPSRLSEAPMNLVCGRFTVAGSE